MNSRVYYDEGNNPHTLDIGSTFWVGRMECTNDSIWKVMVVAKDEIEVLEYHRVSNMRSCDQLMGEVVLRGKISHIIERVNNRPVRRFTTCRLDGMRKSQKVLLTTGDLSI